MPACIRVGCKLAHARLSTCNACIHIYTHAWMLLSAIPLAVLLLLAYEATVARICSNWSVQEDLQVWFLPRGSLTSLHISRSLRCCKRLLVRGFRIISHSLLMYLLWVRFSILQGVRRTNRQMTLMTRSGGLLMRRHRDSLVPST